MAFTCDPKDPRAPEWLKRLCRNLKWFPFVFILFLISYGYLTVAISFGLRYHLARKGQWVSALFEVLFGTALAGGAVWSFIVAVFKDPGSPVRGRGGDREGWGVQEGEGEEVQSLMRGQEDDSARAGMFNAPLPGQPQYPARSGRQQLNDLQSLSTRASSSSNTVERRSNIWVKSSGESRWCAKCDAPKPDRTHHCSRCARCVLRMDHHCPWLANRCVGLRNHKAFFLFITYTGLFCAYCCQETARALLWYVENENNGFETSPISWAVVLFLGFIFGSSLVPFAGYHAYLICKNRTSIESMEGSGRVRLRVKRDERRPRVEDRLRGIVRNSMEAQNRQHQDQNQHQGEGRGQRRNEDMWRSDEHLTREERRALKKASKLNVYDVGIGFNWRQIMGNTWYLWFVPIGEPLGDGFTFLVQTHTLKQLEQITASIRVRDEQRSRGERNEQEDEDDDEDGDDSVYGGANRQATRFGYAEERPEADAETETGRDTGMGRKAGQRFQGAHGEMEWGDAPKKSFVLFGVDDEDE